MGYIERGFSARRCSEGHPMSSLDVDTRRRVRVGLYEKASEAFGVMRRVRASVEVSSHEDVYLSLSRAELHRHAVLSWV